MNVNQTTLVTGYKNKSIECQYVNELDFTIRMNVKRKQNKTKLHCNTGYSIKVSNVNKRNKRN